MDNVILFLVISTAILSEYCKACDTDPYLTIGDAVMSNNSAVINNGGKVITCNPPPNCDNISYSIIWVDSNGNILMNDTSHIIHSINGGGLKSGPWTETFDASGVYTCQLYSTMELKHELNIAINKSTIDDPPILTVIQLHVYQYYPLIAALFLNSSVSPPTNVHWSIDGYDIKEYNNCYNSYQILTDRSKSVIYSIVLDINGCYGSGQFNVSVNTNGYTNTSKGIIITQASSPTNFKLVNISTTLLTVSWSTNDTTQYCVTISLNITICINNTTPLDIPGDFGVNSSFTVSLVSIGHEINTIPSYPEIINISLESPSTPTLWSNYFNNNNSINIIWNNSNYNNNGYIIPVTEFAINITSNDCQLLNEQRIITISDPITNYYSYLLTGLQPAINYCISISLTNSWGSSSQSTDHTCFTTTTTESTAPLSAPIITNITNTTQYCSPAVIITWTPIICTDWNGLFDYYRLCINNTYCQNVYDAYTTNIMNLTYATQYSAKVARININQMEPAFSNEAHFTTTKCYSEPPGNVYVLTITIKTCSLKWSPPHITNGIIMDYKISYSSNNSNSVIIQQTNTSIIITGLYPNTLYIINITAVNEVGESNPITINITTKPIETITDIIVDSVNDSLIIRWFGVNSTDIDYYIINYIIGIIERNITINNNMFILPGIPKDSKYTISVIPVVIINKTNHILGQWTNISGCHGDCKSPLQTSTILISSSCAAGTIILIILIIICVSVIRCKHNKVNNDYNRSTAIEMHRGGQAPSIIGKLDDLYVIEGTDVVLHAPVIGQPIPEITWFYNDDIIGDDGHFELDEENDSNLLLINVQLYHAGVYHFTATNSLGTVNGHIRLFVEQEKKYVVDNDIDNDTIHVNNDIVHGDDEQIIKTKEIALKHLADYILKMNKKNKREFKRQFENLQCFERMDNSFGKLPENKRRNRFDNILPYNINRIILKEIEGRGDCNHTYINASYIDGYISPNQFIATQGPLPQTLVDFWRLIWQEKVECIVLLLKDLMKGETVRCQQYWPDNGTAFYGPYKVTLEYKKTCSNYIKRVLMISPVDNKQPARIIHHIQFTEWPDHGIPVSVSPLLALINDLEEWLTGDHPIVIHCSAGVGRTGVLLSILIGLDMGNNNNFVDILGIVNKLRQQRMKTIQTEEQYAFIHNAILEGLYCSIVCIEPASLNSSIREMENIVTSLDMNQYTAHHKVLQVLSPSEVNRNKAIDNPRLSRSKLYLPPDDHRVVLQKKTTDFIHASFLSGYQHDKSFIVAESPTIDTAGLFWQMIIEQECSVIVMLCDCVEIGKYTCYPYWPASIDSDKHIEEYRITNNGEHIDTNHIELQLQITNTKNQTMHDITQIQVLQWSPSGISSDHKSIIATIGRVEIIQRKTSNKPILVHCSDTVSRSGVFCTLYNTIQQLKTEQIVNIYQILKSLRIQKPLFVPNETLYRMIYELLERYLESEFDIYKNFSKSTECLLDM